MNDAQGSTHTDNALVRSLRSTVGRESTTFGFSILVTVTFGVLQSAHGSPSTLQVFVYGAGAVMSFTILEGVLSSGFRRPMPQHATQTLTLGTSLNVVSVLAALAAAWGFAEVTRWPGRVGWCSAARGSCLSPPGERRGGSGGADPRGVGGHRC